MREGVWHNVNSGVFSRSGRAINCVREINNSLYYVAVYALPNKFKAYGPKVALKGTTNSFCICWDEIYHIRDYSGWCVWSYPHQEYRELPPRDDWDRDNRPTKFHWGESCWFTRWIEHEVLVSRSGTSIFEDQTQICETNSSMRLISIAIDWEWHAVEHSTLVNGGTDANVALERTVWEC